MASYIESAVLRVEDQTSAQLAKISANLKRFFAATKNMSGSSGIGGLNTKIQGLRGGVSSIQALSAALQHQGGAAASATKNLHRLGVAYDLAANKGQHLAQTAQNIANALNRISAARKGAAIPGGAFSPPGGGGRRGGGNGGNGAGFSWGNAAGKFTPSHMAMHITARVAYLTASSIEHAAVDGAKEQSSAKEKLYQRGWSLDERTQAFALSKQLSAKYQAVSRADVLETLSDIGAAVHVSGARAEVADLLAKRQQLAAAQGQDGQQARQGNVRLIKTLEMSGSLVDAHGHFNKKRTEDMMDMIQRVEAVEGRNIDARQIQQAFKYMRQAGLSESIDNLQRILFLGAEVGGSSAGTGFNQMIRNLTGHASVGALKNLIDQGYGTGEFNKKGKLKPGSFKLNDEDMLRSDMWGWLQKNVAPTLADKNISAKDSAKLASFFNSITSDRTASDTMFKLVTQAAETQNKMEAAKQARYDSETAQGAGWRAVNGAFAETKAQWANFLGNDVSQSALILGAKALTHAAEQFQAAFDKSDLENIAKASSMAGMGAGALAGAAYVGSKGFNALFNPLTASATALDGSAGRLNAAAAALTRAAARQGAAGALGGAGAAAGAAAAAPALVGATGGIAALTVGTITVSSIAAAALTAGSLLDGKAKDDGHREWGPGRLFHNFTNPFDTTPTAKEIEERTTAEAAARRPSLSLDDMLKNPELMPMPFQRVGTGPQLGADQIASLGLTGVGEKGKAELDAQAAAIDARLQKLRAEVKRQEEVASKLPENVRATYKGVDDAKKRLGAAKDEGSSLMSARATAEQMTQGIVDAANPFAAKIGGAFSEQFGGITAKISAAGDQLRAAMDGVGPKLEAAGASAGQKIEAAMTAGGNAAAAAIKAAVSNVQVDVNVKGNGAGPNVGSNAPKKG